jgi:hypothetical protein
MTTQIISALLRLQMVNLFRPDASFFQHISCILGQPWGDHYHKRVLGTNESQSHLQDQSTRQIGWSCEQGHIGQVVAHAGVTIHRLPKNSTLCREILKDSPLKVRKVESYYLFSIYRDGKLNDSE